MNKCIQRMLLSVILVTVFLFLIGFNALSSGSKDKNDPKAEELAGEDSKDRSRQGDVEIAQAEGNATGDIALLPGGDNRSDYLKSLTRTWNTDWSRRTIEYSELQHGGPSRDGIPSIDNPEFLSSLEVESWLRDNEPVIVFVQNGDARAYPLQILIWHEIVNDTVGGVPVLVTFCPLCNSSIVFDRRVDGSVYEFGTSGLLRYSDLVMYDRVTDSLWQQLNGEGIVGKHAGTRLKFLPSSVVSFSEFKQAYPEGKVLSRNTGYARAYGRNPYVGYDRIGQSPFLFDGELDGRLSAMERVVAVTLQTPDGEIDIAYPYSTLGEKGVINDVRDGISLVVFYSAGTSSALDAPLFENGKDVGSTGVFNPVVNGRILTFTLKGDRVIDEETRSTWDIFGSAIEGKLKGQTLEPVIHADHFWFAWAAFKPDTIVYRES